MDKVEAVIIPEDKYEELKRKCVDYPASKKMSNSFKEFVALQPLYLRTYNTDQVWTEPTKITAFQVGNNLMEHFTWVEDQGRVQFNMGKSDVRIKKPVDQCVT